MMMSATPYIRYRGSKGDAVLRDLRYMLLRLSAPKTE